MNKYNQLGMELLEYKSELSKKYPEIVLKSLNLSIDELAHNSIIDIDIHYALKGEDTSIESLKELLLTKKSCIKTDNELLEEYDVIRRDFDKKLRIDEYEGLQTKSIVESGKVVLVQDFIMTEDFVKNYFYIESDKDFETLMSRKNFLHKFAILRLEKIMRDFIKTENNNNLDLTHSSVFYHEKKNVYGIQLMFSYNIESLEKEESINELAKLTIETIENGINHYNRKMLA